MPTSGVDMANTTRGGSRVVRGVPLPSEPNPTAVVARIAPARTSGRGHGHVRTTYGAAGGGVGGRVGRRRRSPRPALHAVRAPAAGGRVSSRAAQHNRAEEWLAV